MTQCPRCGKDNPADIHTCTPLALRLADALLDGMNDEHWDQLKADAAAELCRQHAALERETARRQAAQIENEDLKERIARSGVEQQRAVLAEREACANVCEAQIGEVSRTDESIYDAATLDCAAAIRARGAAPQQEGETQ